MRQAFASWSRRRSFASMILLGLFLAVPGLLRTGAGQAWAEEPYALLLKSGTFTPAEGDYAAGLAHLSSRAAAGDAHLFVQLREIPSTAEREALAAQGIHLLSYLPQRAWLARVSSALSATQLGRAGVRWIAPLQLEHKVSARVRDAEYAPWSEYTQGRRIYVVQMHEDVPEARGREILSPWTDALGGYIRSLNTFIAALDPSTVEALALTDEVRWVDERPPVLSEVNDGIRAAIGVDTVHQAPYRLNGAGSNVLVYDAGLVGSHPDFGTRVTWGEGGSVANHSTHVAGTVGGDGTNSGGLYEGMAPACRITSYLYESCSPYCLYNSPQDIEDNYREGLYSYGADLASNSLGSNIAANGYPCSWEGDYETTAQLLDAICRGSLGTPFLSVWAAGNERHYGTCGTGYNTTGVPAPAKNIIVVGATMSNDHSMSWFSSWGPVDDGRLRPDVCAPGCQSGGDGGITSTMPGGGYGAMCGTSMATPAVSGVLGLVLQQMRQTPGGFLRPLPSTFKALLINTAQDYGNVGPDFQFGFGEIRVPAAVDAIRNRLAIVQSSLDQGGETTYEFMVDPGTPSLRATVAWSDVPGQPLAQRELVNDLDVYFESPSGSIHYPWVLDPSNPATPATRGTDHRNPVEQVQVTAPPEGVWRLHVVGTTVPQGPQSFTLVASLPLSYGSSSVAAGETANPARTPSASWVRTGPSRPNPSRGATAIEYSVERPGSVQLRIRDVTGRLVRTLDARPASAGTHQAMWDGCDATGRSLPSGIYFYRAEDPTSGGAEASSRSLLLLR